MLRKNAELYPTEVALVEVNPQRCENRHISLARVRVSSRQRMICFRREMTWQVFDEKANRFANLLLSRGIRKDDKVAVLLYNCIEWLPIYFGVLKSGATVVPLNFRYSADEIHYCVEKSDADILVFGPEFTGRVEEIVPAASEGPPALLRGRRLSHLGRALPGARWPVLLGRPHDSALRGRGRGGLL